MLLTRVMTVTQSSKAEGCKTKVNELKDAKEFAAGLWGTAVRESFLVSSSLQGTS